MRRGDVKRAAQKREQEHQEREAKMHSIPYVKMETQELLSLHTFCPLCLGANEAVFLYCPFDYVRFSYSVCLGTKMAMPGSLVKLRGILWMWTPIAPPWDGQTGHWQGMKMSK